MTPGGAMGSGAMSSTNLDDNAVSKYMLDIHLFKGTVYVFMDFIHKFIHVMASSCNVVCNNNNNNNSYCSSSNHSMLDGGNNSGSTFGR